MDPSNTLFFAFTQFMFVSVFCVYVFGVSSASFRRIASVSRLALWMAARLLPSSALCKSGPQISHHRQRVVET